ncbi:MAG: tetratricopeptide repeat protein [Candidatus Hodarchaeota archaeon]
MRAKIYSISIIVLLGLLLFMAKRQFMADLYWKMAHQDGRGPRKTIGYLEKCIAIDNENALFHFSLGRAFLHEGLAEGRQIGVRNKWIRRSIDEFHKAIDLEPSNSDYHFHLGMSYGSLPYPPPFHWEIIQNSFERTILLNPTNVQHLYSVGIYYLNKYHRLKTIKRVAVGVGSSHYKRYAAMSKENYQLYFRKLLDVNEEYLDKVLKKCFSVTQKYTDLKDVIRNTANDHGFFARFLDEKGMWKEAEREYREAINLEPANQNHYSRFAHALARRRYYVDAIYWWQKQKLIDPGDRKPYLFSADSFMKLKRFDDAFRELRDLMRLYPENVNYQIKLIKTFIKADRVDEAIKEYRKILEKNPHLSKEMYDSVLHFQKKGKL